MHDLPQGKSREFAHAHMKIQRSGILVGEYQLILAKTKMCALWLIISRIYCIMHQKASPSSQHFSSVIRFLIRSIINALRPNIDLLLFCARQSHYVITGNDTVHGAGSYHRDEGIYKQLKYTVLQSHLHNINVCKKYAYLYKLPIYVLRTDINDTLTELW